jgi:sugar-specific transcriptional regulator TrmB
MTAINKIKGATDTERETMVFNSKSLSIFRELGMTTQQAKVYLSLSKLEQATVKTIAIDAQMARAEVYRVIPELQKSGLIKKIITTPISYKAVQLSEGLSILLHEETEKHKEKLSNAEQFLQKFRNHNREKPSQENSKYYLTTGLKAVTREYLIDLQKTQESKEGIISWRAILHLVGRDFEYLEEALERGVKFRYITHIPEGEKMPQIIQTLKKTGSFEIKSASVIPKAELDIYDKKIVHIIIPGSGVKEIEVLRSDNPAVVDLLQDYFDMKWQAATAPCWPKKNHQMRT